MPYRHKFVIVLCTGLILSASVLAGAKNQPDTIDSVALLNQAFKQVRANQFDDAAKSLARVDPLE